MLKSSKASNYFKISKDLHSLYLKTGNKKIEDLFIHIYSAATINFVSWILESKNKNRVKSLVADKSVIDAIIFLIDLQKRGVSHTKLIQDLANRESYIKIDLIPYVKEFAKHSSSFSFLNALSNEIMLFSGIRPQFSIGDIRNDLEIIDREYNRTDVMTPEELAAEKQRKRDGLTRKQRIFLQKQEVFKELYNGFVEKISEAARANKNAELERLVKEGWLLKPYVMSAVLPGNNFTPLLKDKLNYMIKYTKELFSRESKESVGEKCDLIRGRILNLNNVLPYNDPLHPSQKEKMTLERVLDPSKKIDYSGSIAYQSTSYYYIEVIMLISCYMEQFFKTIQENVE